MVECCKNSSDMKEIIFCIITVPDVAKTFVVTSKESEKQNIKLAMEKNAVVSERIGIKTGKELKSLHKEILRRTGNIIEKDLLGFDDAICGDLATEEFENNFRTLAKDLKKKH
jgi:hypothetical protein